MRTAAILSILVAFLASAEPLHAQQKAKPAEEPPGAESPATEIPRDGTPAAVESVAGLSPEFGVKAALNLPSFLWLDDNGWNAVTGLAFGAGAWVYSDIPITGALSLQVEAGYAGKGASLTASDGSLLWHFHYVEVPIWAKFSLAEYGFEAWAGIGGYYGYFLGGSYAFDVAGSEWVGDGSLTVGDSEVITEVRRHDFGVLLTAGLARGHIVTEFRFPIGVSPVMAFTPSDPTYGGYRRVLNSGFALSIGYRF